MQTATMVLTPPGATSPPPPTFAPNIKRVKSRRGLLQPRRLNFSGSDWGSIEGVEKSDPLTKQAIEKNKLTTHEIMLQRHRKRIQVIMWHLSPIPACIDCDDLGTMCFDCLKTLRECTQRMVELADDFNDRAKPQDQFDDSDES